MNNKQIQKYVMRFLEATECQIIEKHPAYVTAKLSPAADRELTGRTYYWSFVERTGAEPQTMTYTFVFDPEKHAEITAAKGQPARPGVISSTAGPQQPQGESILGRYFGFVPTSPVARVPQDHVTFGSKRLLQLFDVARSKGRYVCLFEEPDRGQKAAGSPMQYSTWLCVNFKAQFICDMKRDELHSLGMNLSTGEIVENFYGGLSERKLTPKLPAHVLTPKRTVTLQKAAGQLEQLLERKIKQYDHSWAEEAQERLQEELLRIEGYYTDLLKGMEEEEKKNEIQAQFDNRKSEIEWQYRPRVEVDAVSCGIFHLDPLQAALK
ncbi:YqhG family protein [Paenibacillus gansuensis]|uniref:YqhG family protein n=1 Tax=Paenibacillus gansuensis TaxID=306542 RepID=A0ABW5PDY7_9BACL